MQLTLATTIDLAQIGQYLSLAVLLSLIVQDDIYATTTTSTSTIVLNA